MKPTMDSVRIRNSKNRAEWAQGRYVDDANGDPIYTLGRYGPKETAHDYGHVAHGICQSLACYPNGEIVRGLLEEEKPIEEQKIWGVWCEKLRRGAQGESHFIAGALCTKADAEKNADRWNDDQKMHNGDTPFWRYSVQQRFKTYDASQVKVSFGGVDIPAREIKDVTISVSSPRYSFVSLERYEAEKTRADIAEAARDRNANLCQIEFEGRQKAEAELDRIQENCKKADAQFESLRALYFQTRQHQKAAEAETTRLGDIKYRAETAEQKLADLRNQFEDLRRALRGLNLLQ